MAVTNVFLEGHILLLTILMHEVLHLRNIKNETRRDFRTSFKMEHSAGGRHEPK